MTGNRTIYYILAAFIAGNLLLIYTQYNSSKNIDKLITGNESLLSEFRVDNQLHELEKNIISIESGIRNAIIIRDSSQVKRLERQIGQAETALDKLQKINDDDSSVKFIQELDLLVHEKLKLSNQILDTFRISGRAEAEKILLTEESARLTEKISLVVHQIDSSRQRVLAALAGSIDDSGRKARRWGTLLISFVLITGSALFWFITNRIRQQNYLISQLDASERKVRVTARIKENFMANMSHEIRTPMNAILGFTGLLSKKTTDPVSVEYVHAIRQSGERLLTIINDILDLSKIEAGMMRIESAPFNTRELANYIEALFNEKATEKKLRLSVDVGHDIPLFLEGDATRLTQILVNIVGNAIKFTAEGTVTLDISGKNAGESILIFTARIADTGIGIPKEKLLGIFDRFQQAEDSTTRRFGGTGLGLAIVKDLVDRQGGNIEVESEQGKGTVFTVIIPYKITAGPGNKQELTEAQPQGKECITALIVEDNEINQSLLRHLLSGWNMCFDIANNGREALVKLSEKSYDVILMDIQMPEMDGYSATHEIRTRLKLSIPVIAMTAHAMKGEREKCLDCGMNDYLSKPIRENELYNMINLMTSSGPPPRIVLPGVSRTNGHTFKTINLDYMKTISGGNEEYEKTVTGQFIETIPEDLRIMQQAWEINDQVTLRKTAHNMRTSVSVMGINDILEPHLDALEYHGSNDSKSADNIKATIIICENAVEEARGLYALFSQVLT